MEENKEIKSDENSIINLDENNMANLNENNMYNSEENNEVIVEENNAFVLGENNEVKIVQDNKETKKYNNTILYILIVIISLALIGCVAYYAYEKYFNKEAEPNKIQEPVKNNEESEENEDPTLVNYGILSVKDINPFKNLDFNKLVSGNEEYEMNFDSTGITIDIDKTIKLNIKNIKQIALSCMCGGCDSIYYLTDGGELYDIHFDHQSGIESLEHTDLKEITKLVAKNVKHFTLLDLSKIDPTTCGGYYVVYRNNDNKELIIYGDKEYDTKSFERLITESVFDGFNSVEGSELYIVSKNVNVKNYLKDTKGNNLIAKNIYTFSGISEDGDGEPFYYLYVLNEDNYLYYFEDYTNGKVELYNDSKVKSIKEKDEDIVVTFENGKEETIDATEFKIK